MIFLLNFFIAQAVATSPSPATLDGNYHRPCYVVETDTLTTDLSIQNDQWKIQHTAYEDENCTKPYLIYEVVYKFKSANNHDLDLTTQEASYTLLSDEVSRALNMTHYCGFTDWTAKVKKVVTGKLCDDFQAPQRGDALYSIFTLNSKESAPAEIFLGTPSDTRSGKTPETRYDQVEALPLIKTNPSQK